MDLHLLYGNLIRIRAGAVVKKHGQVEGLSGLV